ncbi:DUF2267 domain-containing protein [Romeria aff. gracilis LEGE 07310]|uniref:DUF2267 domain-containing protein n=1 Tax=Vasconcelosia minhoensis LEGE 07310 TaxID=915328 RepID=A0A8J7DF50_9CYAN|nr:DUF2267 domain-containing protein [Romeria gracilis]MBE9080438.1 DUF2267 domain-containing protein [Romeria aff. gracilis LEGE 07310]
MKYNEFISEVQDRASLDSQAQAERATQATLQTLAERISGDETDHLCAQLTQELAQYLQQGKQEPKSGQVFSLEEFVQRVSDREQVTLPAATQHARLVLEVLQKAVTPGEISDVRSNLPADFEPLFSPVS